MATAATEMNAEQQVIQEKIDLATAARQRGNEHFKAGDFAAALKEYWSVVFSLRGLDNTVASAYPADREIVDGRLVNPIDPDTDPQKVKERAVVAEIKKVLNLTYTNMAASQIKLQNYKKALGLAQDALKLDENNRKAKFREAQARIGLGETIKGRRIMEELQLAEADAGIEAAIKELELAEKQREKKNRDTFKGFLAKQKGTAADTPAPGQVSGPRFEEVEA